MNRLCNGYLDDSSLPDREYNLCCTTVDTNGLIAQGREVYLAALKDPDSLADVEPYGNCCFESLTYVGDAAYRQLTGENINENADPAAKE